MRTVTVSGHSDTVEASDTAMVASRSGVFALAMGVRSVERSGSMVSDPGAAASAANTEAVSSARSEVMVFIWKGSSGKSTTFGGSRRLSFFLSRVIWNGKREGGHIHREIVCSVVQLECRLPVPTMPGMHIGDACRGLVASRSWLRRLISSEKESRRVFTNIDRSGRGISIFSKKTGLTASSLFRLEQGQQSITPGRRAQTIEDDAGGCS